MCLHTWQLYYIYIYIYTHTQYIYIHEFSIYIYTHSITSRLNHGAASEVSDVEPCTVFVLPVSVKNHSSEEKHYYKDRLPQHQLRDWIAVSAEGLQGKGSPKRSVVFTDTVSCHMTCAVCIHKAYTPTCICTYSHMRIPPFSRAWIRSMHVYRMHTCSGACMDTCSASDMHVCTHTHTRVCVYIYIYIYTYAIANTHGVRAGRSTKDEQTTHDDALRYMYLSLSLSISLPLYMYIYIYMYTSLSLSPYIYIYNVYIYIERERVYYYKSYNIILHRQAPPKTLAALCLGAGLSRSHCLHVHLSLSLSIYIYIYICICICTIVYL